jgi:hypothetical protein
MLNWGETDPVLGQRTVLVLMLWRQLIDVRRAGDVCQLHYHADHNIGHNVCVIQESGWTQLTLPN